MNAFLIILVVLTIITALLFIPVTVRYTISYNGKLKSEFVIKVLFYKNDFSKKKVKKPKEKKNKKEKPKKKFKELIEDLKYYKRVFEYFKGDISKILIYAKEKTIKIKNVEVNIAFAGSDAMHTGIYTGIVNATTYNLLAIVNNSVGIEEMSVEIKPDFNMPAYAKAKISCILNTKLAHIIVILIKMLKIFIKYKIKGKEI